MKTTGNTILLTGGGSGIGRRLAQRWHDAGNVVIVTGRTLSSLQETIEGRANLHARMLDVTDPAAIAAFASAILAEFPALNVLVNNAGIMRFENLTARRNLADAEATIATNLLGPIRMTNAFVDHLAQQADAAIVNVSSGLAFVPLVAAPAYSATKAAIHSYSQSLRHQLAGSVEVIELAPPGVQTDLTPGQATRANYLPLKVYIDQTMALFAQFPTPSEVLVPTVVLLRDAEAEHRYPDVFTMVNSHRGHNG
ncbi:MAG: oxidoreductase [Novosphingobium sp. 12-64-8]|nr:MAG: oxidoreductase [Novosphingobium sp. 12-64-8]